MQLYIKGIKGFIFLSLFVLSSCSSKKQAAATGSETPVNADLDHIKFTVEEASEWTNLFKRNSGWFGGDGIFVIPHNGLEKASADTATILFSDTMIGEIVNDSLKPGFVMIHNSVATIQGSEAKEENIQFHWDKKKSGAPESIFIPATPASKPGDYYWLGDGFVNPDLAGNTYIFGYRVRDVKVVSTFSFEQVGNTLIIIPKGSKPPYKDQRQIDIPFFTGGSDSTASVSYGSGIFVNTTAAGAPNADGYLYVYGVGGKNKNLKVARVLPKDVETFGEWRFWDGKSWVAEMSSAGDITNHVSNELSVSPLPDGRYALLFQVDGISSIVGMRLGSSPVGPFGPIIPVYDCKGALNAKKIFPYNAKAHPALSQPGELLVSYNVNSFDFANDIKLYPNLYRPRFIRIKF